MLKRILFVFVAIFINVNFLFAQNESLIDEILELTKERSVYKNRVDWDEVEKKVKNAINTNADSLYEKLSPAVGVLLDELNDSHSFIQYKERTMHRATPVNFLETINEETKTALKLSNKKNIETFKFDDTIGYIQIPGMPEDKDISSEELAQIVRDSLCALNIEDLKGVLVDLRLNTGGDMWPMIAGVTPLLDDGISGYFVVEDKYRIPWGVKRGKVYQGNKKMIKIKEDCSANKNIKIALLIGPATGSSGEMTAVSFIGKPNTKLFGERTAGYVTANYKIKIREDLYYLLSESYVADRNKNEYRKAIDPDVEIIGGDNFEDLYKDKKVSEAIKWIETDS